MVFLLTQCATSIVFCWQSKIKLLLVWKLLLLADTKCLLCLSFSNLLFMPEKEINSHFNFFFLNAVYETNNHWAVSMCSYWFCKFMHPSILWDPVSFVCPGGELSAGSVIQVMPTLPLGPVVLLDLGSVSNLMWNWAIHSYWLHGWDPPKQFFQYYFYFRRWPLQGKGWNLYLLLSLVKCTAINAWENIRLDSASERCQGFNTALKVLSAKIS